MFFREARAVKNWLSIFIDGGHRNDGGVSPITLGQKQTFNDWIMQEMAPHSLGRTTLLHKSVPPIAMILFSMISSLEKSY